MFKPVSLHARSIRRLFGVGVIAAMTTACGYKGPLYLPPPPDTLNGQDNSTNKATTPLESPHIQNIDMEPVQAFSLEPTPVIIE